MSDSGTIKYSLSAETFRFYAYVFFWGMCIFAITCAKVLVTPILAAGPTTEGDTCGPFNRNWPEKGLEPGMGFDFATESHLQQLFGFANICANWDYSPSRELTAMVYPLFEYSLLVYLILDFWTTTIAQKKGELEPWVWTFSKIVFPINVFLCAQFRMIFVCIAYQNVKQHTAGFLGLQLALVLVAVQNSLFLVDSNASYDFLGGMENTRKAVVAYLCGLIPISLVKITATIFVVQNGHGAPWTLKPTPFGDMVVGQVVDIIWMIFNAILPLIISYIRSKRNIDPLVIEISSPVPSSAGENEPLNKDGGEVYLT